MSGIANMVFANRTPPAIGGGGGPTDEYFSNVELLLHGDGSDNGTSFPDSSNNNVVMTRVGSGILTKTAIKKFGTASMYSPGDSASLLITSTTTYPGLVLGSQDFTFEGWLYPTTVSGVGGIFSYGFFTFISYRNGTSWVMEVATPAQGDGNLFTGTVTSAFTVNTWHHYAITRSGNTMRMFVNGVQRYSSTTIGTSEIRTSWNRPGNSLNQFGMFSTRNNATTQHFLGYEDDFRITVGQARYTANFSVPTAAFPDS